MTAHPLMPGWTEHVRDACWDAVDPLDDAPSAAELADQVPTDHAAVLASLPAQEARAHARNLAAWHTHACGPDPLAPVLHRYWGDDNTEET